MDNFYPNYYDQSQQGRNPPRSGVNPQQLTPVGYQQPVSPKYEFTQQPQGYQSSQQRGYQQSTYQQGYPNDYERVTPPIDHNQLRRQPTNGFGYDNFGGENYEQVYNEKYEKRRSARHVELTHGNLVLDCPVPDKVLRNVKYSDSEEFSTMRYTAVTCDPDDFIQNKYLLRPHIYGRKTELMIVMTMYNEDDKLFIKTMSSAIKNVAHLCSRSKSKTWGRDGWQKVVVVIVSDGRNKINKRTLNVLGAMGVYQDGIMQDNVDGKP
ncbi:35027_t:CDS:2, partial [Racocetra persica]